MTTNTLLSRDSLSNIHLENVAGVVIRQDTRFVESIAQTFGIPYEATQQYKISILPHDSYVARYQGDPHRWRPSNAELKALPVFFLAYEQSNPLVRVVLTFFGCANLRPFTMPVRDGSRVGGCDMFRIVRPCRVGVKRGPCMFATPLALLLTLVVVPVVFYSKMLPRGANIGFLIHAVLWPTFFLCWCMFTCVAKYYQRRFRLQMNAQDPYGRTIGKTFEFMSHHVGTTDGYAKKLWACCCRCTSYDAVVEVINDEEHHIFTTRTGLCCFGRHNNCCGGTCCRHDLLIDILDADTGVVVGSIQKTYAPAPFGTACCRMLQQYNSYLLHFPAHATRQQRALLIMALLQTDYEHFEKTGGSK